MSQPLTYQEKLAVIEKWHGDLGDWEYAFYESITTQIKNGMSLTERQRAIVDKIYNRISRVHAQA